VIQANVAEIFESVQGEGKYAGALQVFVRFSGCPVGCYYCDTDHSEKPFVKAGNVEYANPLTPETLIELLFSQFEPKLCHSISFTGGEPIIHDEFIKKCAVVLKEHKILSFLETSGFDIGKLMNVIEFFDFVSLDIKTTSEPQLDRAEALLKSTTQFESVYLKLVVSSKDEPFINKVAPLIAASGHRDLWLQPMDNIFELKTVVLWQKLFKEYGISAYFVPQIHKLINIK
jgi:organic radical activating enzyme